jgi:hypothetical protein
VDQSESKCLEMSYRSVTHHDRLCWSTPVLYSPLCF